MEGKQVYTQFVPQNLVQEKTGVSALTGRMEFKMMPVEEFCELLDEERLKHTDLLALFKQDDSINTFCKRYEDLTYNLKQQFLELKQKYLEFQYKENWRKVISDHLEYRQIQIVGDHKS